MNKQSIKAKILILPMIFMIIVVMAISSIVVIVNGKKMTQQMEFNGFSLAKQLSARISESESYSNIINEMLSDKTLIVCNNINNTKEKIDSNYLKKLCIDYDVEELNFTDNTGKIIFSNNSKCIGNVITNPFAKKALETRNIIFEPIRKSRETNDYYKYGYYKNKINGDRKST